ncbi:hypothetical protein P389DRAFT_194396 [Cystobasidium minutum MCA 4210]|uniref:uncharacterized protein n=1 Tax=Cystobasidium minutum MCA 4210 TaxID=1397322 RepID=UPI0034CEBCC5|eukprot:jgi/Rhomi1/194396/gm1.2610_g
MANITLRASGQYPSASSEAASTTRNVQTTAYRPTSIAYASISVHSGSGLAKNQAAETQPTSATSETLAQQPIDAVNSAAETKLDLRLGATVALMIAFATVRAGWQLHLNS